MNFGRWSVGLVAVQARVPQTFTIMLLSVAEWLLSKPFKHRLHPVQKLLLGKTGIKITKQFNLPTQILIMYNVTLFVGFLKEILI